MSATRIIRVLGAVALAVTAACGARSNAATTPSTPPSDPPSEADPDASREGDRAPHELEPIRVKTLSGPDDDHVRYQLTDARALLDRGNAAMAEERYDEAIALYEQLLEEFPGSSLRVAAMYNLGLAYEALGDADRAVDQYRRLLAAEPEGADSIDAHVRIGAVLAEAGRFAGSEATLEQLARRRDLTKHDELEVYARLGYARLEQSDFPATAEALERAVDEYRVLRKYDEATPDDDYHAAMAYYYQGQIAHRQFLAHPIRGVDEQRRDDIEAKARLLREANDRYTDAMVVGQPYWATAAVYQMSEVYKQMWDGLITAPPPPGFDEAEREAYRAELHREARELLKIALRMHTRSVEMAELYGVDNRWKRASEERLAEIGRILAKESAGEMLTPEPSEPLVAGPTADETRAADTDVEPPGQYVPERPHL